MTEYSALYPPAFGQTIAFAYEIAKKYQYSEPGYMFTVAKLEIHRFTDDLLMRMPTEADIIREAEATGMVKCRGE